MYIYIYIYTEREIYVDIDMRPARASSARSEPSPTHAANSGRKRFAHSLRLRRTPSKGTFGGPKEGGLSIGRHEGVNM